ncbi:MAG: AraC family transcriptional regulator [Spirochaetota bacterium]
MAVGKGISPASIDASRIDSFIEKLGRNTSKSIALGGTDAGMISLGFWRPPDGTHAIQGRFPNFALLYLLRGNARFTDKDGEHHLRPGSLVYRTPGTHRFLYDDIPSWMEFFIQLSPALYNAAPQICPPERIAAVPITDDLLDALHRFIAEFDTTLPHSVLLAKVYAVLGMFNERIVSTPSPADRIHTAAAAIENHLADDIDLEAISAASGMSYDLFRKEFKRVTGTSPMQYRLRKRIERAQVLLANGAASASEVAHRVGYADIFTFFKQFKRITGITPKAYRRSLGRG